MRPPKLPVPASNGERRSATARDRPRDRFRLMVEQQTRDETGHLYERAVLMRTLALVLALAGATTTSLVRAEDYPSHPIRLIVPFAAGGAADSVARIVGKRIGDAL